MKSELLEMLRCPQSGQLLKIEDPMLEDGDIRSGWLVSMDGQHRYPIRDSIPRFVPESNYADNFGMQWNIFSQTQLDSYSGHPISAERFWKATKWTPDEIEGKWVLDVGCGSGRFAEIALQAGAKVIALDYSSAVDACYVNLKHHANLHVVQGDIYSLPFANASLPYVYSLGVLQHTPDVAKAFAALPPIVQAEGSLCVDYYYKTWRSFLLPKYWLRPITTKFSKDKLFNFLTVMVPKLFPISWFLGKLPGGHLLKRVIPVADPLFFYTRESGGQALPYKQHVEWSLLDTFDWFSPEYDNPPTATTVLEWMQKAKMRDIEVFKQGHLVAHGRK